MIELIPAIDIIEGKCVRLTKGDYATKKEYGDPVSMAQEFEQLGFKRLHVVDLDGAKNKHVVNDATLRAITRTTQLTVDFGGGVKTEEDLKKAYEAGATLVTVGSIAVTNPEVYLEWLQKYGTGRLILGADVRKGKVSINGWLEDSDLEKFIGMNASAESILSQMGTFALRNGQNKDSERDNLSAVLVRAVL